MRLRRKRQTTKFLSFHLSLGDESPASGLARLYLEILDESYLRGRRPNTTSRLMKRNDTATVLAWESKPHQESRANALPIPGQSPQSPQSIPNLDLPHAIVICNDTGRGSQCGKRMMPLVWLQAREKWLNATRQ